MAKISLDKYLVEKKLFSSKSSACKNVQLGLVKVAGKVIKDPKTIIDDTDLVESINEAYVSRAGLKLEQANKTFKVNFTNAVVLDVGSSTGGFSDYSLKNHAQKVTAIELGSKQMDSRISLNPKVELHEKTDIRDVYITKPKENGVKLNEPPDIVLIDLSFISLKYVLPHITKVINSKTYILALAKPQFEATSSDKNKGIVKNQKLRREILKDLEDWLKNNHYIILNKVDSTVHGLKGNIERFYLLKLA